MPVSPDTDLESIKEQCFKIGAEKGAKGKMDAKIEPIAFGLSQLLVLGMFEVSDDNDFDAIAAVIGELEGVNSAEVYRIDLAMG